LRPGAHLAALALVFSIAAAEETAGHHESRLDDNPRPLQTDTFPARPAPIVQIGQNPFLGNGYIAPGFQTPTGAVWQPVFIVYGTMRSALQSTDNGAVQNTEWVNRLDLFGNLYLTPTERILVGLRPLDEDGKFTGYQFKPRANRGSLNQFNSEVSTLFFEGDFGELFPRLDPLDRKSLDYGFSVGRQPLSVQDGIMINNTIDSIGVTRSSMFLFGSTASHVTALYGWNRVSRNNNIRDHDARLFLLSAAADYAFAGTFEADLAYVSSSRKNGGDGFFAGAGMTRRFGKINSTIRINSSWAIDRQSAAVSTGTLLFTQWSYSPPHTNNNLYLDGFWGIDQYSSAARGADAGGPLGQTGILFAAVGLGNYGAALGNRANSTVGSAIGYQMFFQQNRRQLTLEVGGRTDTDSTNQGAAAAGLRLQQAVGRHLIVQADAFVASRENLPTAGGGRVELMVKF
jgi:hypothetical protein